jgi:hypothetical protein
MAKSGLKVAFFNDFSGGLNNNQQRQNLLANESPDCQDVVFNARGGFSSRRGFRTTFSAAELSGGYIGGQFSAGTEVLWGISNAGRLWTFDGSTYTHQVTANPADSSRTVMGVTWTNRLYFANWLNSGSLLMRYWTGSAFVSLSNVVNNNYSAPTGGNAPLARLIADHSGHMWWADTVESGTRHRSRLRFSHPLQPEDFAAADYFDIEPDDQTNHITALVPFKNMLLVFKHRGVFAVYGYDKDTFVVERISTQTGCPSQGAVSVNAGVAYWWSGDGNVYAFNGQGVVPIGERIINVVYDGTVLPAFGSHVVMWGENRLWVSLATATSGRILFMYDPAVGQNGAWTRFTYTPTSMFWWRRNNDGVNMIVFTQPSKARVYDLGSAAQEADDDGGTVTAVPAYYRMAWYTSGDTALVKRWRRPTITIACNDNATLNVKVFHDFNESSSVKQLTLPIQAQAGSMVWGNNWGSNWAGTDPVYEFARLPSLGRSNAVQLRFEVTDHFTRWWVDSIAVPYFEKAYR